MKWFNRGSSSSAFLLMLAFLIGFSVILVTGSGSFSDSNQTPSAETGSSQIIVTEALPPGEKNLQLRTFGLITVTPLPVPAQANACITNSFDEEGQSEDKSNIFIALDPLPGGIVTAGGKIRAWIRDEHGAGTSTGSVVDPTTGAITINDPSDIDNRGSIDFQWEPAIYLTELTVANQAGPFSGDIENASPPSPKFPNYAKGKVRRGDGGAWLTLPAIDPDWTNFIREQRVGEDPHIGEFIWDVAGLALTPGRVYRAQIVVHDGDGDLAIDCTTVVVQ